MLWRLGNSGSRCQGGEVLGQRHQREVVPVVVIVQVEDTREAGSCPHGLLPGPGALTVDEVADAAPHGGATGLSGGDEAHDGPRGLAGGGHADPLFAGVIVAGDALAPAAVAVLPFRQPARGATDIRGAHVLADAAQAAQHLPGAVDVVDAPAAIPAALRVLIA